MTLTYYIINLLRNQYTHMKNCSFFIFIILVLSSCAIKKSPAPIEYNHNNSKLSGSKATVATIVNEGEIISGGAVKQKDTEIITPYDDDDYVIPAESPIEQNRKIIYHEVQVGETIEEIALKYQQTVDEIAMLNDLYPPYYLDEFQIIKIKIEKDFDANKQISSIQQNTPPTVAPAPEFVPPLKGTILTKFGEKTKYGINKGINIAAKQGSKVLATAGGKVIYADYDATFGYLVIIKVNNKNIITSYAHLEDMILSKGSTIKQGDVVGYVGKTGKVDKPQLHFGIREGKIAKDPTKYVNY